MWNELSHGVTMFSWHNLSFRMESWARKQRPKNNSPFWNRNSSLQQLQHFAMNMESTSVTLAQWKRTVSIFTPQDTWDAPVCYKRRPWLQVNIITIIVIIEHHVHFTHMIHMITIKPKRTAIGLPSECQVTTAAHQAIWMKSTLPHARHGAYHWHTTSSTLRCVGEIAGFTSRCQGLIQSDAWWSPTKEPSPFLHPIQTGLTTAALAIQSHKPCNPWTFTFALGEFLYQAQSHIRNPCFGDLGYAIVFELLHWIKNDKSKGKCMHM